MFSLFDYNLYSKTICFFCIPSFIHLVDNVTFISTRWNQNNDKHFLAVLSLHWKIIIFWSYLRYSSEFYLHTHHPAKLVKGNLFYHYFPKTISSYTVVNGSHLYISLDKEVVSTLHHIYFLIFFTVVIVSSQDSQFLVPIVKYLVLMYYVRIWIFYFNHNLPQLLESNISTIEIYRAFMHYWS